MLVLFSFIRAILITIALSKVSKPSSIEAAALRNRVLDLMEDPECVNPAQEGTYEILLGTSLSMTLANS